MVVRTEGSNGGRNAVPGEDPVERRQSRPPEVIIIQRTVYVDAEGTPLKGRVKEEVVDSLGRESREFSRNAVIFKEKVAEKVVRPNDHTRGCACMFV